MSKKNFQKIKRKVNNAIHDFRMFNRNQKLLLALSGGKDSITLLWILKYLNYNVEALHLDLGIPKFSEESLETCRKNCQQAKIRLHILSAWQEKQLAVDLLPAQYHGKQCNICGTLKRQLFNSFAKKNNFDVLLVAHNMNDEAVMLFANNKNWNYAYLKKSYPILISSQNNFFIKRAKPLVYCQEHELQALQQEQNWQVVQSICQYSNYGSRLQYNQIFHEIEKIYPDFLKNYYLQFLKTYEQLKEIEEEKIELKPCPHCQELTSASICRICAVKEKVWQAKT